MGLLVDWFWVEGSLVEEAVDRLKVDLTNADSEKSFYAELSASSGTICLTF